jgi:2-aminoadipate transaminase
MYPFSRRMSGIGKSFLDEILKFDNAGDMISFAGGLPNAETFPVSALSDAAAAVLRESPRTALQYNLTEGWPPLREYIAERYWHRFGLVVPPERIVITNGSQQGMDLVAKLFLDPGDRIAVESPSYLGAMQAFRFYQPAFVPVPLGEAGIDADRLREAVLAQSPKLLYAVPNFQNPTGRTCSRDTREAVARVLADSRTVLLEDDPFGEIRFRGEHLPPIGAFAPERTVMLGTFSKIVTPGLRVGWVAAPAPVAERLAMVKQAADLHAGTLDQMLLCRFLADNDLDAHIASVATRYGAQCDRMIAAMEREFPPEVAFTRPDGGLFLWVSLPEGFRAMDLYRRALAAGVACIPGEAFFADGSGGNTFRLNFSNTDADHIERGIARLGRVIRQMMARPGRV